MAKVLTFEVTENSNSLGKKELDFIYNFSFNGIDITPIYEETVIAWDAGFEIWGRNVVITGGLGPSGFGKVTIEIPVTEVNSYYTFTIDPRTDEDYDEIAQRLTEFGYTVKELKV